MAQEYHGARSHVLFCSTRRAGRSTCCELADLLLIVFGSRSGNFVRMTWLQAKVSYQSIHAPSTRFRGDLEQWELLGTRPPIRGRTRRFQPPSDLLSAALLPSVGSFGVFYPDGGSFNMAYFAADCLQPVNIAAKKRGTLFYSGNHPVRMHANYCEAVHACCLLCFEEYLMSGIVGTPVQPMLSGTGPRASERRLWFSSLLRRLENEEREREPEIGLAAELRELLELPRTDEALSSVPYRKAVVIRVDESCS